MPNFNAGFDVQDLERVQELTAIPYIRRRGMGAQIYSEKSRSSAGELLRLLVYHLDRFRAELLPLLEVPPFAGGRYLLCVNLGPAGHATLKRLATESEWSMTDVLRALVFHHWRIREEYRAALPRLTYVARMTIKPVLSFAPDRLQPWYYHAGEEAKQINDKSKADQMHVADVLRRHGVIEAAIAEIMQAIDGGREDWKAYEWQGPGISPAAMREAEFKAEGM